jgi:hypothetical protein
MEQSTEIKDLAAALALAQSEIKGAIKDSANPFFKSKYADLTSVWDACRAAITKNGLSVIQTCDDNDAKVTVTTQLMHSSGQWIRGQLSAKPAKSDPQGIGSCITYLRRYALAAMVGVAPEDDDGNAATLPQAQKYKPNSVNRLPNSVNEDTYQSEAPVDYDAPDLPAFPDENYDIPPAAHEVCQFGKNKGVRWADMTVTQLNWYADAVKKSVNDSNLAKFKNKNEIVLNCILNAIEDKEGVQ